MEKKRKIKWNPSSRILEAGETSKDFDVYPIPSQQACPRAVSKEEILLELAEKGKEALRKKLDWERKSYSEIQKIIAFIFLILGLFIGIIIGGMMI